MKELSCLFVALGSWRRKGVPLILEAMSMLRDHTYFSCNLLILGNPGKGDARLLQPYQNLINDGKVRLLGFHRDIKPIYASSDVLVVASYYEAFSLVMLDALHYGLPIISTNVNGTVEMVTPGVNGYIVPHDAVKIAKHIEILGTNRSLLKKMGQQSLLLSNKFDNEKISRQTELQYFEALIRTG